MSMLAAMKVDGRTLDHKTLEHLRLTACRRVLEDGEPASVVAASLGFCRTSIYPWLRRIEDQGWEALAEKIAEGPACLLTEKQRQRVKRWIVGKDPRQYGFEFGLWTRRIVQTMIRDKFAVSLSLTSVGKLLAQLGLTPQKPLRRAYERDPARIQRWREEAYPKLKKRARKHGASIYFLDEAGFSSEPNLRRTYGLKGETPVVKTSGQRQKVNVISAVNVQGAFWCEVYTHTLTQGTFIGFLKAFMTARREKVFLVLDSHPAHIANAVKEYVQSTHGKLELHFLPPYAPDLNPDEFGWNYLKGTGVAKKPLRKDESLKERVKADLAKLKKDRPLLRSFFRAESVAYASY
jgi:transposase